MAFASVRAQILSWTIIRDEALPLVGRSRQPGHLSGHNMSAQQAAPPGRSIQARRGAKIAKTNLRSEVWTTRHLYAIIARPKECRLEMTLDEARTLVASVPHWHHRFEILPGVVTPGIYDPSFLLEKMALPANLSGRSVLDIGPSDGYFCLNFRRRGARVVAVDYRPKHLHGFAVMERNVHTQIKRHRASARNRFRSAIRRAIIHNNDLKGLGSLMLLK